MNVLIINSIPIYFTSKGKGMSLVFLHGFIESHEVWYDLSREISKNYNAVCIDLPGHGKSGCAEHTHTMEFMAEIVNAVLVNLKIEKCVMIGHSMGGYVTLNFAQKYSKKLLGFCLLHSHPYEDSDQKKKDRRQAIKIVEHNPDLLISEMIPNLFANKDVSTHKKAAETLVRIAGAMPKQGIIKAMEGMIERKDKQNVLKKTKVPVLIILGMQDEIMNFETMKEQFQLSKHIHPLVLDHSGHVGFIEEQHLVLETLKSFVTLIRNK